MHRGHRGHRGDESEKTFDKDASMFARCLVLSVELGVGWYDDAGGGARV